MRLLLLGAVGLGFLTISSLAGPRSQDESRDCPQRSEESAESPGDDEEAFFVPDSLLVNLYS